MNFLKHSLTNALLFKCSIALSRITKSKDFTNFKELLLSKKDNSVSIHHKKIHVLAILMCKNANVVSPEIVNEVCRLRDNSH